MSDSRFTKLFFVMISLMTCLTIVLVVLAYVNSSEVMAALDAERAKGVNRVVAERMKPVGTLRVGKAEPRATVAATPSSDAGAQAVAVKSGQEVFQSACFACHGTGVAGAPKLGDAAAWETRVAAGVEVMYERAINGFTGEGGFMPAKGGFATLADDEVRAAVDYMVEQLQ